MLKRHLQKKFLICFYEMFYRNFLSLNVLKNSFFFNVKEQVISDQCSAQNTVPFCVPLLEWFESIALCLVIFV